MEERRDKLIHWLEYDKPAYFNTIFSMNVAHRFTTMCGKEFEADDEAHTSTGVLDDVTCAACHAVMIAPRKRERARHPS